jgi:hypothetical protein
MTIMQILTKYEKDIIDHFLIRNNAPELNVAWFNHAIANTLPSWRSEQLVDTDNSTEISDAFTDYKKDLMQQ